MSRYGSLAREQHKKPKCVQSERPTATAAAKRRDDYANCNLRQKRAPKVNRLISRSENDYITDLSALQGVLRQ